VVRSPVIAICNDIRSKALIPLKKIAQVVTLEGAATNKLKARLREICNREGVRIQDGALVNLIRESKADVRSCVNTLQLLAATKDNIDTNDVKTYLTLGKIKDEKNQLIDVFKLALEPTALRQPMAHKELLALLVNFELRPLYKTAETSVVIG